MKTATVKMSEILKHPTLRIDAEYHIGKLNGEKAHKKNPKGFLVEDDTNGKVMLTEKERKEYNTTTHQIKKLTKKIKPISDKVK
jgi:hypothetical protein